MALPPRLQEMAKAEARRQQRAERLSQLLLSVLGRPQAKSEIRGEVGPKKEGEEWKCGGHRNGIIDLHGFLYVIYMD